MSDTTGRRDGAVEGEESESESATAGAGATREASGDGAGTGTGSGAGARRADGRDAADGADGASVALVGAVGGAGTTRTVVEVASAVAADGGSVAVVDAAYATQGLAAHLSGTLRPDATALVTDAADEPLAAGLYEFDFATALPGRAVCCPVDAPFERLARAKRPAAAERLGERIRAAAARFDVVLADVPPVASNPAVAAVDATARTAVVAPATDRGADGVARARARLSDLGARVDLVVSTFGDLADADVGLPRSERTGVDEVPACPADEGAYPAAVVDVAEAATGRSLDLSIEAGGLFDGLVG